MNNGEDLKNTVETSMQPAEDRERFKRNKTIKRKGFDGVCGLDHAAAHRVKKPLELVIEAKLLLATDEEEEIFKPVVCYTEPYSRRATSVQAGRQLRREESRMNG